MVTNETHCCAQDRVNTLDTRGEKKNIFVAYQGCYHNLHPDSILWITSEGNYVHIHTKEKHYFNRISMASLLKLLPTHHFKKIHKCHLVRLDAVEYIDRTNNELVIAGKKIPIGRSYKANLLAQLNLIG
jgi:DNA-binding LytR/AlgR family response regulator